MRSQWTITVAAPASDIVFFALDVEYLGVGAINLEYQGRSPSTITSSGLLMMTAVV
jgi:hypothetical protein